MLRKWTSFGLIILLIFTLSATGVSAQEETPIRRIDRTAPLPSGGVLQKGEIIEIPDSDPDSDTPALLSEYDEEELFAVLEAGCLNHDEKINISKYKIHEDDIGKIYFRFAMTHPELLLRTEYQVEVYSSSRQTASLFPGYLMENKEADEAARATLSEKSAVYVSAAKKISDPIEQLLYIHDAIIQNVSYDYGFAAESYHSYGFFQNGTAVCQGYAQTFYYITKQLGYEVNFAMYTDPEHNEKNHMWNYIKVDGSWYHLDATWDDPDNADNTPFHTYFLVSDSLMEQDADKNGHGFSSEWSSYTKDGKPIACSNTRFETGYLFNFPNPVSIVREGDRIGFYMSGYFFCSDSLYTGNLFASKPVGNQIYYFYLTDSVPASVTIRTAYMSQRGVMGKMTQTVKTNSKNFTIYTLSLGTAPAKYPKTVLYFWDTDTLEPCGQRVLAN